MLTTSATRHRRRLRRRAAACALALLAVCGWPVEAAPAPARKVVTADLKGTTTVTWSGNAAIRLRVPKDTQVPASSYRLTLRTGRYVSVRAFENPQPIGCERDLRMKWCAVVWLDWLRDLAETSGHGLAAADPQRDFLVGVNDPPVVRRGMWDLYLFTDGRATLEITARGVPGRAAYVAGGRFTGRAVQVKGPCRAASCLSGPLFADQRYGGASFDVGRLGFAQALTYGAVEDHEVAPGTGPAQSFALRACQYPSKAAPEASADPSAHPLGCDSVPMATPGDTVLGSVDEVGSAAPAMGRAVYGAGTTDARGRVYLGIRATSAGAFAPRLGGLLVFLRYGITPGSAA